MKVKSQVKLHRKKRKILITYKKEWGEKLNSREPETSVARKFILKPADEQR